jgi:hypothetical protein
VNENFKKLLEQSYSKAFEECIQRGHQVKQIDAIFNSIAMDEFAELIVRECEKILIEKVEVALDASGNPVSPEDFIKQHFGVE